MIRTLDTYKEQLFEQIEDLKGRIKELNDLEQDNQLDITKFMAMNFSPGSSPDAPLRHVSFQWCYDNDIHYKILNKEIDSDMMNGSILFTFIEFKNSADLIAFKLRWMTGDTISDELSEEDDDDDIPF